MYISQLQDMRYLLDIPLAYQKFHMSYISQLKEHVALFYCLHVGVTVYIIIM